MDISGHADPNEHLDIVVFSGHKVDAPGSPGVVVTRKDLFAGIEPQEVGGGMGDDVLPQPLHAVGGVSGARRGG